MILLSMMVESGNCAYLAYPTLIDDHKKIVGLAIEGVDMEDRRIVRFTIKCDDGCVREYTPEQILLQEGIEFCRDCGKRYVMTGHQECMYPRDHF